MEKNNKRRAIKSEDSGRRDENSSEDRILWNFVVETAF